MQPETLLRVDYEKNKRGLCATLWCPNPKIKGRRICYRCKKFKFRIKHPIRNTYNNWRTNAKRRGKFFSITLDEFRAFCIETNYMELKGRSAKKIQIDRIENDKGYTADNIQALSGAKNVQKYYAEDLPF